LRSMVRSATAPARTSILKPAPAASTDAAEEVAAALRAERELLEAALYELHSMTMHMPPLLGASPAAGGAAAAVRALELAQAAAEQTLTRSEPRLAAVERTLAVAG